MRMFCCSELHLAKKHMYIDATGRNLMKHFSKHAALHGCANKGLDNTSLENTLSDGFIDWNLLIFYQPLSHQYLVIEPPASQWFSL